MTQMAQAAGTAAMVTVCIPMGDLALFLEGLGISGGTATRVDRVLAISHRVSLPIVNEDYEAKGALKVTVVHVQKVNTCWNPLCEKSANLIQVALQSCDRCKKARYCSRECQVAHWKRHKPDCAPVQALVKHVHPKPAANANANAAASASQAAGVVNKPATTAAATLSKPAATVGAPNSAPSPAPSDDFEHVSASDLSN